MSKITTKFIKLPIINFMIGLPDSKIVAVDKTNNDGNLRYIWSGNTQLQNLIQSKSLGKTFAKDYTTIIWHNDPERNFRVPNVFVNCISDADICSKSLKRAIKITEGIKTEFPKTYIYNDPKKVLNTTRDAIYNQFHHLENIVIPKVIRLTPANAKEVFQIAQKSKINFPFLMRPCGSHQSEGLQLIRSINEIDKLHKYAFDGREFYITEFVENKHPDGFYKKARLVIIEGELYARHYISYPNWLVEGMMHFDYMKTNEDTKIIEENFLKNFKKILGPKAIADLFKIYEEVGLNFLAFDMDIMPDGKLLIFEINLAQNIFLDIDMQNFAYMKESADKIKNALIKSVLNKI